MSKIKLSENLFLEVAELSRMIKFLDDDGYKLAVKSLANSFGILRNPDNTYFKVYKKPETTNIIVVNPGVAFNSNMDAIILDENLEIEVSRSDIKQWVILSRGVKNTESGSVNINADGSVNGIGTEFTKVLRGQPNFPTKVKFQSSKNTGEYEVVNVISDTSIILSGDFVAEQNVKYSVIGTFTPGFQPLETNKMIYEYDSCDIKIVESNNRPDVTDDEFIIASIDFSDGNDLMIDDERENYIFNETKNKNVEDEKLINPLNPLVSLLSVAAVGGVNSVDTVSVDLELILEHGYRVTQFKFESTPTDNIFTIVSGTSNYTGNKDIPDDMFKGWLLVNRKNMEYVKINGNTNKILSLDNFKESIIEKSDNDFIIIPNFNEIEYEVRVSNNVNMPSEPFYFRASIWNVVERMKIYAFFPSVFDNLSNSVSVHIRYRMLNNSTDARQYPFNDIALAQYTDINGQNKILSGSSFTVNLTEIEPQAKKRNYS